MNFENLDTEYEGFEFAVKRKEKTEWHQTKMNAPRGNWTINALIKAKVLSAFSNRLSDDENAFCFFITQDNAKELRALTEKARVASSYEQFYEVLSKANNDGLQLLKTNWDQPPDTIFNWLRRSYVEIIPERELDSLIESYGDLYFNVDGKTAFSILRNILEENFNTNFTRKKIIDEVNKEGSLKFKDWQFDPTIEQMLIDENDSYLQTYTPFGAGGITIERKETVQLLNEIMKKDGPSLILLTGVAGSGKSGIVRSVINQLIDLKIPHLAFRVDQFLSCDTRETLGSRLTGRDESPVSTLKGTFPDKTSVLIIDQVDAISEVSGRKGKVKEVIFRLITDANNFGGVRILSVCRTFDLDSDPRLKSLRDDDKTKKIEVPIFDWISQVEPLLQSKQINVKLVSVHGSSPFELYPGKVGIGATEIGFNTLHEKRERRFRF